MVGIDPDRFAVKTDGAVRQFSTALFGLHEGDRVLFTNLSDQVLREMDLDVCMYSECGFLAAPGLESQWAADPLAPLPRHK